MTDRPFNVLFLCTGNSARSIIAEAILNKLGAGKFQAYQRRQPAQGRGAIRIRSSCSRPRLSTSRSFRSKSWSEFAKPGAPPLDFVFTVCDNAAGETCPVWPGQPMTAHWGVPDPAEAKGSEAEIALAFKDTYRMLQPAHRDLHRTAAHEPRSAQPAKAAHGNRPHGRRNGARLRAGRDAILAWPAPACRGARHGVAAGDRGRLGHHGASGWPAETSRWRCLCNSLRDRRDPGRADFDLRAGFGRAFQSRGQPGVRVARRAAVANRRDLHCLPDRGRHARRLGGAPDVRPAGAAILAVRSGFGQWLAEAVATFGLLLTILGCVARAPAAVPYAVGLYITAAYWFTASTSFANPAVTMARSLSDSFAGIAPAGVPAFIVAQLVGMLAAVPIARLLWQAGVNAAPELRKARL